MKVLRMAGEVFRSLKHREYRIFALANTPAMVTDWMQRVGVGWLTWELTHSATWLGLMGFAEYFPSLILSPLAGVLADRFNRHVVFLTCQALLAIQAAVGAILIYLDAMTIEYLFSVELAFGVIKAFDSTSRQSLLPSLVPREDVATAIGFDSLTFNAARVVGPAFAGVVIVAWGVGPTFACNAIAYVGYVVALFLMNPPAETRSPRGQSIAGSLWDGVVYIARHPGIGPMMLMLALVSVSGRSLLNFIPGFAGDVFDRGADGLALLTAAMGMGAIGAGLYLTYRHGVRGLTRVMVRDQLILGVAIAVFAATDWFWLGVVTIVAVGFTVVSNSAGARIVTQNAVIPEMRGRLASYYSVLQRGAGALGALLMGSLAELMGLQNAFLLAAICCLAIGFWGRHKLPVMAPALEVDEVPRNRDVSAEVRR